MDWKKPSEMTCTHCGTMHATTCPRIAAIEYHENGQIKRIEFHAPAFGFGMKLNPQATYGPEN